MGGLNEAEIFVVWINGKGEMNKNQINAHNICIYVSRSKIHTLYFITSLIKNKGMTMDLVLTLFRS